MSTDRGTKHDGGKADLSLFSAIWLVFVGRVLTKGKQKYAAHNWRRGLEISRLLAGVTRHILLFLAGQDWDVDPDCEACKGDHCLKHTGEHHLACASCGIMFATELVFSRPDLDDRHKYGPKEMKILHEALEMNNVLNDEFPKEEKV